MSTHYAAIGAKKRELYSAHVKQLLADRDRGEFLLGVNLQRLNGAELQFVHEFNGQRTTGQQLAWWNAERRAVCDAIQNRISGRANVPVRRRRGSDALPLTAKPSRD